MRSPRSAVPGLLALLAIAALPTLAAAHCCHDERMLGIAELNDGLRPGLHSLGGGLDDQSVQQDPPSVGNGMGEQRGGGLNDGGTGQMRGSGLGSYGAGSIGEPGPGGLGALHGQGIGAPPPRPR